MGAVFPLTRQAVRKIVCTAANRAGVHRPVSTNWLRRASAVEGLAQQDLRPAGAALASNLRATEIYTHGGPATDRGYVRDPGAH